MKTLRILIITLLCSAAAHAAHFYGLEKGNPDLKSAGSLAFGPDGILFIGDTEAAAIIAVETGDKKGDPDAVRLDLAVDEGATVRDIAVNPLSGTVYLSAVKNGKPVIMTVDAAGKIAPLNLKGVMFSAIKLPNPPTGERRGRKRRDDSITDLAFIDGKVLVSGLTDGPSPSTIHEIPFPFKGATATPLEIYHGAHGKYEDYSAVRTFVPFTINGEPSLLAGFICTPLVKVPLKALAGGDKVRGTTVAELGNRNRPLDMIVYEKGGKTWLLMANSARGVMKISTDKLDRKEGITERVGGGGIAGQPYETIAALQGVVQLDKVNETTAVVMVKGGDGTHTLRTVALP